MIKGIVKGLIALVLGLVLIATPASAQIKWGLGIGPTVPMGTFADGAKLGFHAVGIANFDLTAKPISFRADAVYNVNKCKAAGCSTTSNLVTVSGDVAYNFPTPRVHPYLLGGVTWGHGSCSGSGCAGASSSNDIGFNVGGGLHWDMGPTKVFIEARYFSLSDSGAKTNFIPISFGIRF